MTKFLLYDYGLKKGYYNAATGNISLKDVAELVRTGKEVLIVDNDGFDITKECLTEYCLGRLAQSWDHTKKKILVELLTNLIQPDIVYRAVECGSFEDYLIRKNKMLL